MDLIEDALAQDPDRYRAMDGPVFDATVPFGSGVRYRDLGGTETDLPGTDPPHAEDDVESVAEDPTTTADEGADAP